MEILDLEIPELERNFRIDNRFKNLVLQMTKQFNAKKGHPKKWDNYYLPESGRFMTKNRRSMQMNIIEVEQEILALKRRDKFLKDQEIRAKREMSFWDYGKEKAEKKDSRVMIELDLNATKENNLDRKTSLIRNMKLYGYEKELKELVRTGLICEETND